MYLLTLIFYIMKIKFVFALAAVAVLSLASCKKDYTCECTWNVNDTAMDYSFEIKDAKKADAEEACTYNVPGSSVSCELK